MSSRDSRGIPEGTGTDETVSAMTGAIWYLPDACRWWQGTVDSLGSYAAISRVFWHKTHDASGFNSILGGNPRKKHFMSLSWTLGYPQNIPECCRVASLTHGILRFQILRHGQVLMPFSWDMMYWVRAQGSQGSQVALPP
jgi:hypothetical protein